MNLDFLDDIRAALDSPHTASIHLLADVATEYSEAVVFVNRRMRKITRLLDQGLRGEAMQLAGQKPFVLEIVSNLDLPELIEWRMLLGSLGMELPPGLRMDYAERIDNAYAEIRPLEDLLRRHRALALGKAPLDRRIFVLKKLLARDPANPGWTEDLTNLQSARLKEISMTLRKAVARKDYQSIQSIDRELSTPWLVPVPTSLIDEVASYRRAFEKDDGRKKLAEIAPALNDAFVARDVDAGRTIRTEWRKIAESSELDESDALAMETAEALAWLEDEDFAEAHVQQFNGALIDLQSGLDDNVPLAKLDALVFAANQFNCEWPTDLRTRTNAYRRKLKSSKIFRTLLSIAATVGLLAIVSGGIWYFVQQSRHSSDVNRAIESIDQLVKGEDFAAANQVYTDLPTDLKNDSRLLAVKTTIETGLEDLAKSTSIFQSSIARARQAGVETPNFEALDRASESAVTKQQKQELIAFSEKVNEYQLDQLRLRDNTFSTSLDQFDNQLTGLAKNRNTDPEKVDQLLTELIQLRARNVGKQHRQPLVSPQLMTRCTELQNRVEQIQANAAQMQAVEESLRELTSGLADKRSYLQKLESFQATLGGDHFLNDQISRSVRELKEDDLWGGFEEVRDFIVATNWAESISNPESARNVLSRIVQFEESRSNIWLVQELTERVVHLDSIDARESRDGKTIRSRLIDRHLGGFWKKASVLELEDGSIYYVTQTHGPGNDRTIRASYIASKYLDEQQQQFLAPNATNGTTLTEAPHSRLYADIETEMETADTRGWPSTFTSIIKRVLKTDDETMDPLIRNYFLYRTLDACIAGDYSFSGLSDIRDRAKEIHRMGADWAKAARGDANRDEQELYDEARNEALKLFVQMKHRQGWSQGALDKRDAFVSINKRDDLHWKPVGLVVQNEHERWAIHGLDSIETDETIMQLFCLYQKPNDNSARFHPVATVDSGTVRFVAPSELVSGRAVFLRANESKIDSK